MEHDLAKVGVAGSSPVSRSQWNKKKDIRLDILFLVFEPRQGSKVRGLRSAPVVAEQTSPGRFATSRALDSTSYSFADESYDIKDESSYKAKDWFVSERKSNRSGDTEYFSFLYCYFGILNATQDCIEIVFTRSVPEIPGRITLKCDGSAICGNGTGWRRSRHGCSSQRTCRSIRRLVQSPRRGTDIHTEPHGTATWCSRR